VTASTAGTLPEHSDGIHYRPKAFNVLDGSPRHRTLQRLRERFAEAVDELREARGCSGAQLLTRSRYGSVDRYSLGNLERWIRAAIGDATPRAVRVLEFCAWVLTVQKARMGQLLVTPHRHTAILLGCSERTAGSTVRDAVRLGLIRQHHSFHTVRLEGADVVREREASYAPTTMLLRLVELRGRSSPRAARLLGSWAMGLATVTNRRRDLLTQNLKGGAIPSGNRGFREKGTQRPEALEARARERLAALLDALEGFTTAPRAVKRPQNAPKPLPRPTSAPAPTRSEGVPRETAPWSPGDLLSFAPDTFRRLGLEG
jgi:hypothetical protein